jgi:succinoglycan biosynthesis protein ExoM
MPVKVVQYVNDMTIRFSVCIGTFRRPSVVDTVKSLLVQEGVAPSEMEIIVADDDPDYSARPAIEAIAKSAPVVVRYVESAARNISACRNACLRAARADWIAFIDDDQVAEPSWLREMIAAAKECRADAVKCYVRGIYPPETPHWVKAGDMYTRDYGPTGTEVGFGATCGILFRRDLPGGRELFFDTALGVMGGADTEFFMRYKALGGKIVSCRSSVANEIVSVERVRAAHLQRKCRRHGHINGRVLFANRGPLGRSLAIAKSLVGVTVTSLYSAVRIVHASIGCWMFMKFWYHFGVLEWAVGRKALRYE